MIREVVDMRIDESKQEEFKETSVRVVRTAIAPAKGFLGFKVNHSIESPNRYLLMIYWDTLEKHMVDFRGSSAFIEWRSSVGPFFTQPPAVEHFNLVGKSD